MRSPTRQAVQLRLVGEDEHAVVADVGHAARPHLQVDHVLEPGAVHPHDPLFVVAHRGRRAGRIRIGSRPRRRPRAARPSRVTTSGENPVNCVRVDHEVGPQVVVRRVGPTPSPTRRRSPPSPRARGRSRARSRWPRSGEGSASRSRARSRRSRRSRPARAGPSAPASGRANVASSTITPKNTSRAPTPTTRNEESTSSALCDWAMPTRSTGDARRDQRASRRRCAGGT